MKQSDEPHWVSVKKMVRSGLVFCGMFRSGPIHSDLVLVQIDLVVWKSRTEGEGRRGSKRVVDW